MTRSDVAPNEELKKISDLLTNFGIELQTFRTKNLRTLTLADDLKKAHLTNELSYSSALEIQKLKDEKIRAKILKTVVTKKLSFRKTKELVAQQLGEINQTGTRPEVQRKLIARIDKTLKSAKQANGILKKPQKRKELEALIAQIEVLLKDE